MKKIFITIISLVLLSVCPSFAQTYTNVSARYEIPTLIQESSNESDKAISAIKKNFQAGDAENLSVWFDDNLDVSLFLETSTTSKIQARQIMKSFFKDHKPVSFTINNIVERANLKYMLADLTTDDEQYNVVVFLSGNNDNYRIQQIKINKKP